MKHLLPLILVSLTTSFAQAQLAFSVSDTLVTAVKPATNFVMYNYTQFFNNVKDSLDLVWEIVEENGGMDMGDWGTAIQDPTNNFLPAQGVTTANFVIPPATGAYDKLIYQLFPNNQVGELITVFKIYVADNPADSLLVTFHYIVTDPTVGVGEPVENGIFRVFPNPASGPLQVENLTGESMEFQLFDLKGTEVFHFRLGPKGSSTIDPEVSSGTYLLSARGFKQLLILR